MLIFFSKISALVFQTLCIQFATAGESKTTQARACPALVATWKIKDSAAKEGETQNRVPVEAASEVEFCPSADDGVACVPKCPGSSRSSDLSEVVSVRINGGTNEENVELDGNSIVPRCSDGSWINVARLYCLNSKASFSLPENADWGPEKALPAEGEDEGEEGMKIDDQDYRLISDQKEIGVTEVPPRLGSVAFGGRSPKDLLVSLGDSLDSSNDPIENEEEHPGFSTDDLLPWMVGGMLIAFFCVNWLIQPSKHFEL